MTDLSGWQGASGLCGHISVRISLPNSLVIRSQSGLDGLPMRSLSLLVVREPLAVPKKVRVVTMPSCAVQTVNNNTHLVSQRCLRPSASIFTYRRIIFDVRRPMTGASGPGW